MLRHLLLSAVLLLSSCGLALGQLVLPTLDLQQFPGSTTLWMTPRQGHAIDESTFFAQPGIADVLGINDQMAMIKLRRGEGGVTHRHYQQLHSGALVEGAVLITHEVGGALQSANGVLAYLPFNDEPAITEDEAVMAVQTRLGAVPPVSWEGEDFEVPTVSLIYAPTMWETQGGPLDYRLCYRVSMLIVEPFSSTIAHVDARTGEIFRLESALQSCSQGSALTLYNGWQDINSKYFNFLGTRYELRDDCRGDLIHTRMDNHEGRLEHFYKHSACDDVKDGDNIWQDADDKAAVSLHWAAEMFHDYLQAKLGRNGLDGNGVKVKLVYHPFVFRSYINIPNAPDTLSPFNAFWIPSIKEAHFGRGDGISPYVSLDVVSHELTHGVISYEMQDLLQFGDEAKALGESFADIFGTCSEWYNLPLVNPGRAPDFTIAEDVAQGPLRSIRDLGPPFNLPRAYQQTNWDTNGNRYVNCTVQSYWFYLLSYGSWGKPTEVNTRVCGIGMDNAARIAYNNIVDYLGVASTYADARQGSIQAAIDIFGAGSDEVLQCGNAWAAVRVGIGGPFCFPTVRSESSSQSNERLEIYPNPTSTILNVMISLENKAFDASLSLWSSSGNKIADLPTTRSLAPSTHRLKFDCSNIPGGTYHLLFSTNHSNLCTKVVIIH